MQVLGKEYSKGKGSWKFPNYLLEDENFIKELRHNLTDMREEPNDTNISEWWEDFKNVVKIVSTHWSKTKKRSENLEYTELCKEYRNYEKETPPNLVEMDRIKKYLDSLEKARAKGSIIRSKATQLDENEQPSAFFIKTEIFHGKKRTIEEIEVDGIRKNKQTEILQAFTEFYSNLYKKEAVDNLTDDFLKDLPRLPEDPNRNLGLEIKLDEIKTALNQMENNKSPGPDGLTKELYTHLFDIIGPNLVKLYSYIFQEGKLTDTMRISHITLLCKNDDAPHLCKNYRPISLLNVDYKIISKILSNRLRTELPKIIHPDQTCSVKGRSIQDNCHYLRDIINDINSENNIGILLSLDQEKAFDRVSHDYILNILNYYGFSPEFQRWIKLLYSNISSSVIVNGHISPTFPITRSVRQGCPLSPLIYILALEPVLHRIRSDPDIEGCPIPGNRVNPPKLTAYADDCKCVVKSDQAILAIINHFDNYGKFSGAKLNKNKTELMYLGRWKHRQDNINNITVKQTMTSFGITFGSDEEKLNWQPIIKDVERKLQFSYLRNLSIFGKAKLINIMVLPRIWYLATVFPPTKDNLKKIESLIFNFIWEGKYEKIARITLYLPVKDGGIGLVNIQCKYMSLFLNQMMKVFLNEKTPWVNYGHMYLGLTLRQFQGYTFNNCEHPHRLLTDSKFYNEIKTAIHKLVQADPNFTLTPQCNSKTFYKKLIEAKNIKPRCINNHPETDFRPVFHDLEKPLIDPIALNITYQLIHGVLPTASRLYRFGVRLNPDCKFCKGSRETIDHLFLHCALNHLARQWLQHVCFNALGHPICEEDIRRGPNTKVSEYHKLVILFLSEYRLAVWVVRNRWRYYNKFQSPRDSLYMFKNRIKNRLQADYIRLNQMIFDRYWIKSNLATITVDNRVFLNF